MLQRVVVVAVAVAVAVVVVVVRTRNHIPKRIPLNPYILYAIRPFLTGGISGPQNKTETAI